MTPPGWFLFWNVLSSSTAPPLHLQGIQPEEGHFHFFVRDKLCAIQTTLIFT